MSRLQQSAERCEASEKPSVLFLGRTGCDSSKAVLAHLTRLGFDVTSAQSNGRGEALPEGIGRWNGDYIVSFRSLYILPDYLLRSARIAAINFHPAPPEYPGSGCINFALYDGCTTYGVTAHLMNKNIDNGRILECRRFPIHDSDTLLSVLSRTHSELTNLCKDFMTCISNNGKTFIDESLRRWSTVNWRGNARSISELENLQTITPDITEHELHRIIRSTYTKDYPPKLTIHGYEFILSSNKKKSCALD